MLDICIAFFSLLAAVAIHEAGHALAAVILDFRIQVLAVWPVSLYRTPTTWRLGPFRGFAPGLFGLVRAYPVHAQGLQRRAIAMTLAGPAFSIGACAICTFVVPDVLDKDSYGHIAAFLGFVGLWSFFAAAMSLLPVPSRPMLPRTDGRRVLDLLFGRKGLLRASAIFSLNSPTSMLRPREWAVGLVTLAFDDSIDMRPLGLNFESAVHWLKYNWYADTGETALAGAALEWLLSERATEPEQHCARWEAVWFEVFSNNDPSAARSHLQIAERFPTDSTRQSMRWKARAAVAAAEGRGGESQGHAARAISFLAQESDIGPGFTKAIEDDLKDLLRRYGLNISGSCNLRSIAPGTSI